MTASKLLENKSALAGLMDGFASQNYLKIYPPHLFIQKTMGGVFLSTTPPVPDRFQPGAGVARTASFEQNTVHSPAR